MRQSLARRTRAHSSANYASVVLADSPVGYWRLGEASGTVASDSSGNSRNGTYTGGYTLGQPGALAGDPNTAVALNGSTGLVSVPNNAAFQIASNFTVEAWVYPTSNSGIRMILTKGSATNRNYDLDLDATTGNLRWFLSVGGTFKGFIATTAAPLNQWSHVAGTYDGATMVAYLNGASVGSTAASGSADSTTDAVNIGCLGGAFNFFPGDIDEAAIYATALSAGRILAHYNAGI